MSVWKLLIRYKCKQLVHTSTRSVEAQSGGHTYSAPRRWHYVDKEIHNVREYSKMEAQLKIIFVD